MSDTPKINKELPHQHMLEKKRTLWIMDLQKRVGMVFVNVERSEFSKQVQSLWLALSEDHVTVSAEFKFRINQL